MALEPDMPIARSRELETPNTFWGVILCRGKRPRNLVQNKSATFPDSCWEIMVEQSERKYWPGGRGARVILDSPTL